MDKKYSILMVCTGNICRSPTAEIVLQDTLNQNGWENLVHVDSAGTYSGHCGDAPDTRSQIHATRRGYDMSHLKARGVTTYDIDEFDLILGMEETHVKSLKQLAKDDEQKQKIQKYLNFSEKFKGHNMSDPYYGGDQGFENVLDQIEDATKGIIQHLRDIGVIPS